MSSNRKVHDAAANESNDVTTDESEGETDAISASLVRATKRQKLDDGSAAASVAGTSSGATEKNDNNASTSTSNAMDSDNQALTTASTASANPAYLYPAIGPLPDIDYNLLPPMPLPKPDLDELAYPFTHKSRLLEMSAHARKPALPLYELARSVMLSDVYPGHVWSVRDILRMVADHTLQYTLGNNERWEKSVKEVLRSHYCFTAHARTYGRKGAQELLYSCDVNVDPKLKKQTGKRKSQSLTPFSHSGTPFTFGSPTASPSTSPRGSHAKLEGLNGVQSKPTLKQMQLANAAARAVLKQEEPDTNLPFIFETSIIFEKINKHRGNDVYYCLKCGPVVIWRRRRDSMFILSPLLRLLHIAFGNVQHPAAEKLYDLADEDDVVDTLLKRPSSLQRLVPLALVREMASGTNLDAYLAPILAEDLPELDNSASLSLLPPREHHPCRYCEEAFESSSKMRRHLRYSKGTCQLSDPARLSPYLDLLNAHVAAAEAVGWTQDDGARRTSGFIEVARCELDSSAESENEEDEAVATAIPPSLSYWSEQEKERLYRALARHSRWRPDLVAADIRTKSSLEVENLISYMDDQVALLDEENFTVSAQVPAAREMSDKWLDTEASLAEDCIVWEAFAREAERVPWQYRDAAQLAVAQEETLACLHPHCETGACDGQWPICGPCEIAQVDCEWPFGFHPSALPDGEYTSIKEELQPMYSKQTSLTPGQIAQQNMLESLSWLHLSALHTLDSRQTFETNWEFAGTHSGTSLKHTRRTLQARLRAIDMGDLPLYRKEATYRLLKEARNAAEAQNPDSAQEEVSDQELKDFVSAPATMALAESLESRALDMEKPPVIKERAALRWSKIAIAKADQGRFTDQPELVDIADEVQLASKQLLAVGVNASALGDAAILFNLRKMANLMDLYRYGSEDMAHISRSALQLLLDKLREYVSSIIALSLLQLDAHRGPTEPSSKETKASLFRAIAIIEKRGHPRQSREAFLNELESRILSSQDGLPAPGTRPKRGSGRPFEIDRPAAASTTSFRGSRLFDDDILVEADSVSDAGSASDFDGDGDDEDASDHEAEDKKIDEADRLKDLVYEERLWDLLNDARGSVKAEEGEDEADLQLSATASEDTDSASASDEEDEEEEGMSIARMRRQSPIQDDASIATAEDAQRLARISMDLAGSDNDDGQRDDGPSQRRNNRPSVIGPYAKTKFRTRELISTSDEEDL